MPKLTVFNQHVNIMIGGFHIVLSIVHLFSLFTVIIMLPVAFLLHLFFKKIATNNYVGYLITMNGKCPDFETNKVLCF